MKFSKLRKQIVDAVAYSYCTRPATLRPRLQTRSRVAYEEMRNIGDEFSTLRVTTRRRSSSELFRYWRLSMYAGNDSAAELLGAIEMLDCREVMQQIDRSANPDHSQASI
jgi:hypothetical protein